MSACDTLFTSIASEVVKVIDDARTQRRQRAGRAWGRDMWKAEKDKERANEVAQQVGRAAAQKVSVVCDQRAGLRRELAEHIEAPNMWAGGSHPQATMMQDSWATSSCPSASESHAMTSVFCETDNRVRANKGTFAPAGGFRRARTWSAVRTSPTRHQLVNKK